VTVALAVLTKAPIAGRVKTRLVPPLSESQAAAVHAASVADVIARARALDVELRIFHDEAPAAAAYFAERHPDLRRETQCAGSLGRRIADVFARLFTAGAERVAVIGGDSPTLPPDRIARGLARVREHDVALGPAADGGYYLVAIRRQAWPRAAALFRGIPWSTGSVLERTLARGAAHALTLQMIEPWYDIDGFDDLRLASRHALPGSHLARLLAGAPWATGTFTAGGAGGSS
jgi:uncharacterized protein